VRKAEKGELPNGPMKIVVGSLIGVGLLAAFFQLLSVGWFVFCTALLLIEAWSFFNPYENDTISEVIWALSERPLVPLLFGAATGWAITNGVVPKTTEGLWIAISMGIVLGHFFWQRRGE
jgi:hypothetical protein